MDSHAAFMPLFLKHQGDLKAFIGSLVRDRHAQEDLFQEVALILWQKFPEYDASRSYGAWARGIAAKKILQRWEKLGRLPHPFNPRSLQAVLDAFERTESATSAQSEALAHCLEILPDKSRQLLVLRYEQSLTLGEIASQVNSTLDAVHKALSRLRVRLQDCVSRRLTALGEAVP